MAQVTRYEHWGGFRTAVKCPKLEGALMTVMERMPEEDFGALVDVDLVIWYAAASSPEPMFCPPHDEEKRWWLLILRSGIEEQPYECIVGEVAHELAHILDLEPYGSASETSEFDANARAIGWGFGKEILQMVKAMQAARIDCTGDWGPSWDYCMSHMHELETLAERTAGGE